MKQTEQKKKKEKNKIRKRGKKFRKFAHKHEGTFGISKTKNFEENHLNFERNAFLFKS